jgi:hypothetical protein
MFNSVDPEDFMAELTPDQIILVVKDKKNKKLCRHDCVFGFRPKRVHKQLARISHDPMF